MEVLSQHRTTPSQILDTTALVPILAVVITHLLEDGRFLGDITAIRILQL
jgi:hypothetical protein